MAPEDVNTTNGEIVILEKHVFRPILTHFYGEKKKMHFSVITKLRFSEITISPLLFTRLIPPLVGS